jgi:hypothetical protein
MGQFKIAKIDDIEAIAFGTFRRARATLGIASFGLQVLDLPPNLEQYPEHDHGEDGQEEVYITVSGSGEIEIDGERHALDPDTIVALQPGTKRKLWPGPEGIRVIAIGGVPGEAYSAPDLTELGAPDPFSSAKA